MGVKGSARFHLLGSTVVENTVIESQSSVTVDFKWSHVESVLETPPLSSTATLVSCFYTENILLLLHKILFIHVNFSSYFKIKFSVFTKI